MPVANATSATLRLLVMIPAEASGFTARIEWVHISPREIVSIISPPSTKRAKPGSASVSAAPAGRRAANSAGRSSGVAPGLAERSPESCG